jgi:hypothetical protein
VGSGLANEETLIVDPSGVSGFSVSGRWAGILGLFRDSTEEPGLSVAGEGVGISGFLDSAKESGLSIAGEEVGSLGEA